ncbi:hypothetical protein [Streptomyces sp. NPDC059918]|uniref:hypothetical protein n=1 Tax=unclassified Streptomyces TaxID=2593676 RepID=UPI00364D522E
MYDFEDLETFRDLYFPWRADTRENWEARTGSTRFHQFANDPQPAPGNPAEAGEGGA